MKNIIFKGTVLVYTILVITATLVLFILSDQRENFAEIEKKEGTNIENTELPSGARYKTIKYGEDTSIEEIFHLTSEQKEGLDIAATEIDSKLIGSTNILVTFKRNGLTSKGIVYLTITDNELPTITLNDTTIYVGQDFNPLSEVCAQDNVDGDISSKIKVSGTVDSSNEGSYKLAYTVVDSSNNQTEKTREINVIADPNTVTLDLNRQLASKDQNNEENKRTEFGEKTVNFEYAPQVNESVSGEDESMKKSVSFENEPNILVIYGIKIPYQNGGQGSGQAVIDSDPNGCVSTWGGAPTQSGDDGVNTHFIGHNPGIFSVLFSVGIGQSLSVNDSSGKSTTYTVDNILHLDDYGHDLVTGIDYWDQTVGTSGGERITLQTCISDTENLFVLASK